MINLSYTIFKCFGRLTLKPPSFSEKEAKTKAPALSFGHILPSANIIKSNPSLFYRNRGVPPPPNSELKITS